MNPDDIPYEDSDYEPDERPVPKVFYSFYEERPFRCCTSCGETLEDLEDIYQVTKTFHGSEVILEYAMCAPCQQNMLKELSEDSVKRLTEFQVERSLAPANDAEEGRYQCEFCLSTRDEAIANNLHFSMAAICFATDMVERPLFVCEGCMLEINGQMSEKTKGRWREFVDTHFPGVPSNALPEPTTVPVL